MGTIRKSFIAILMALAIVGSSTLVFADYASDLFTAFTGQTAPKPIQTKTEINLFVGQSTTVTLPAGWSLNVDKKIVHVEYPPSAPSWSFWSIVETEKELTVTGRLAGITTLTMSDGEGNSTSKKVTVSTKSFAVVLNPGESETVKKVITSTKGIVVADGDIAYAEAAALGHLKVFGLAPGSTTVTSKSNFGTPAAIVDVTVTSYYDQLELTGAVENHFETTLKVVDNDMVTAVVSVQFEAVIDDEGDITWKLKEGSLQVVEVAEGPGFYNLPTNSFFIYAELEDGVKMKLNFVPVAGGDGLTWGLDSLQ